MLTRETLFSIGNSSGSTIFGDEPSEENYSEKDIIPGKWIEVYCRPMFIYRCYDTITEDYIRLNITDHFAQFHDIRAIPQLQVLMFFNYNISSEFLSLCFFFCLQHLVKSW